MQLFCFSYVVFSVALRLTSAAQVSVQDTGRTLTLGSISYFLPPVPVSALQDSAALATITKSSPGSLIPLSVIPTSKQTFDEVALRDTIATWSATDDVWNEAFLTSEFSHLARPFVCSRGTSSRRVRRFQRYPIFAFCLAFECNEGNRRRCSLVV